MVTVLSCTYDHTSFPSSRTVMGMSTSRPICDICVNKQASSIEKSFWTRNRCLVSTALEEKHRLLVAAHRNPTNPKDPSCMQEMETPRQMGSSVRYVDKAFPSLK